MSGPAMRQVAGGRATERTAASTSLMGRFETESRKQAQSLEFLMNLPGVWVEKVQPPNLYFCDLPV